MCVVLSIIPFIWSSPQVVFCFLRDPLELELTGSWLQATWIFPLVWNSTEICLSLPPNCWRLVCHTTKTWYSGRETPLLDKSSYQPEKTFILRFLCNHFSLVIQAILPLRSSCSGFPFLGHTAQWLSPVIVATLPSASCYEGTRDGSYKQQTQGPTTRLRLFREVWFEHCRNNIFMMDFESFLFSFGKETVYKIS